MATTSKSTLLESIQNRTTQSSRRRAAARAGVDEGIIAKTSQVKSFDGSKGSAAKQGVGEIAGEIGQRKRGARIGTLAKSIENRTTLSSRKRAFNRLLANTGATAGFSGTTVKPRR